MPDFCVVVELSADSVENAELLVVAETSVVPLSEKHCCRQGVVAVLVVIPVVGRVGKNDYVVVDVICTHVVNTDDYFPVSAVRSPGNGHWRTFRKVGLYPQQKFFVTAKFS